MYRLLFLLILASASTAHAVDVIAHRGYGCGIGDNSIEGIDKAWSAGVDAVELDVRVSTDGVAYLFHDDEIGESMVNELSFDEISSRTTDELVQLSRLPAAPRAESYYLLDLKAVDTESAQTVIAAVSMSGANSSNIHYQSDNLEVLHTIREKQPLAKLHYLSRLEWRVPYVVPASATSLVNKLRNANIDGVSIKGRRFVGRNFTSTLRSAGLTVNVWTINRPDRIDHYKRAGVDAIITDEVARAQGSSAGCDL